MKQIASLVSYFLIYLVLCAAVFLMLRMIGEYTALRDDVGFLRFKQDYVGIPLWKAAFYTHVFSAVLALMAAFTQFSARFLKRYRKAHRLIGRIYAWNILAVNFPAGMVLAVYANGHLAGKTAFVLLDCLWFFFTYKGVSSARRKDFTRHREFMIRSYACTFSAITLRTWKIILSHSFTIDPAHLYMIDAWMGFVPNLLLAEFLIRYKWRDRRRFAGAAV